MKYHSPIKIVHIASGDSWAGAEVQLFTLAKALNDDENASVSVILFNHGELENRLKILGIPVQVFDETKLSSFKILKLLIKYLKAWRPSVVHTHRIKENIIGGVAARIASNIPSLRTVHGAPEHYNGWRKPHKMVISFLDNLIGSYLQYRIIAVSEELASLLRKYYPKDKIVVIENGVDIDTLTPLVSDKKLKSKLDNNDTIKIGFVGRLVSVKRVDLFIQIAHNLKQQLKHSTPQFHIYGDGPLRSELETISQKLNVQDIVHFEGHSNNIHKEIASLDLLIITSNHEGLPMTLLEAMALGTLVISHSVGGIPSVLGNGECGYLVNSQDVTKYSSIILDIVSNQLQTKPLIELAKHRVNSFYSSHQNEKKYIEQYNLLMTKS